MYYICFDIAKENHYALFSTYPSLKDIVSTRVDAFTNLLSKTSKGHFSLDKAQKLKELAKSSIGVNNSSLSIQIKHSCSC